MVIISFRETKAVPARWRSGNTLESYSGGPELKFRCRQIIYYTTIETQPCGRAYTPKILKAPMPIDVKCFSITLVNLLINYMMYTVSFFSVNIIVLMCSVHLYLDMYNVFNIVYFVIIFLYWFLLFFCIFYY